MYLYTIILILIQGIDSVYYNPRLNKVVMLIYRKSKTNGANLTI